MNVLFIGTLSGPTCGEMICNLKLINYLKNDVRVHRVRTVSSTLDDRSFSNAGNISLIKVFKVVLIWMKAFYLIVTSCNVLYLTPGLTKFGLLRFVPIILFSKLMGKRVVCHFHGARLKETMSSKILGKIFIYTLDKVDRLIFLSECLRADVSHLLHLENSEVIPNSLSNEYFENSQVKNVNDSNINILYLSNFIPSKGVYKVIDVFFGLKNKYPNLRLSLAGNGDEEVVYNIKEMIDNVDEINFLGPIFGDEKIQLYNNSDIFLFPTEYSQEAFPLVLLEAMASGCLIVSSKYGAIPEILENGKWGHVLKSTELNHVIEVMSDIIVSISSNREHRKEIKNNGLKYSDNIVMPMLVNSILK